MLDKLLGNFKKNLPESLRKKMGSEEESQEDESAEYSEEESEESHDTSANEPSAEDKKKKQISMIIRVVVVLALGYLAATEFIFKPEPENNELPVVNVKRKPRKKPEEAKPGDATADAAKPADPAAQGGQAAPAGETPPAQAQPATEAPAVTETAVEISPESSLDLPKEEVKAEVKAPEEKPPVENINIADKPIDETPIIQTPPAETAPQTGEVKNGTGQVEKSLDALIENMDAGTSMDETPKKSKLEEKIVADDVYTPPPAYDQLGRGLVYNCKEKFWACLDKNAYVACNKNMKWNKAHNKAAECAVQSVYNSDEDCNTVQKYNVSTNVPTTFCQ